MNTLLVLSIGIVIGTFIPMPQQKIVRSAVRYAYNRIREAF